MKQYHALRPRWFRYGLRTMLAVLLAICAWLGVLVDHAQRQKRAVAALRDVEGEVWYDYQWDNRNEFYDANAQPPAPRWIRALVDVDVYCDVVHIRVGSSAGDAEVKHVAELTSVTHLLFDGTRITDIGIEHLKGLRRLRELGVSGTRITDAGLRHLEGLANLRGLNIMDTNVTSDGVIRLQRALPNCSVYWGESGIDK